MPDRSPRGTGRTARASRTRRARLPQIAAGAVALLVAPPAMAQTTDPAAGYPAKPVRIVVPFAPGGGIDLSARLVGLKLGEAWGQTIVVDNRAGAGGAIGSEIVARAPADGYTLLAVPISHAAIGSLRRKLPYDPEKDFTPLVHMASAPNVVVVHPSVPVRSIKELIALARSRRGDLTCAAGGIGSSTHLAGELFRMLSGVELTYIQYKGGQSTQMDLIGGQVSMYIGSMPATLPQVRSRRLRALAVTSSARTAVAPELPTVAEAGVPGYEYTGWYGMLAPAGLPASLVQRLNADMNKVLASADLRERLAVDGAEPVGGTPERFAAHLKNEIAKWAKVVAHAGIKPE